MENTSKPVRVKYISPINENQLETELLNVLKINSNWKQYETQRTRPVVNVQLVV